MARGATLFFAVLGLCTLAAAGRAAPPDSKQLEVYKQRALANKQSTPRNTIETLCFSVDAYDSHPKLIDVAIGCLDITDKDGFAPGAAALLAIQMNEILDELSFPFESVPAGADGKPVTFYEDKDLRIVLERGSDGQWRFDKETVARIPKMRLALVPRARQRYALKSQLRAGLEDPTATMTSFLDHAIDGDFESAAMRLDLSELSPDQRQVRGPLLAWKLACVMQRRGYLFGESVPIDSDGPPYTWSADHHGRIAVERVHQPGGKDTWLFTRGTVQAIERLWEQEKDKEPDARYQFLQQVVPPPPPQTDPKSDPALPAPPTVPPQFASPRALLREFFKIMDDAEYDDAKLADAQRFLDLGHLATEDQNLQGPRLATMLDAIFRKMKPDMSTLSDKWSAPPQVIAGPNGLRVEIVRMSNGAWHFSRETAARLPAMYESISGKEKAANERTMGLGSPRETLITFFRAVNAGDGVHASQCLDLAELPVSARANLGPVLAFKLKSVLDHTGRIYFQAVSNDPDGPRLVLYRGPLGRITLARREDDDSKAWRFTTSTVSQIETMFERSLDLPVDPNLPTDHTRLHADFCREPGIWVRMHMPPALRTHILGLQIYQWIGLVVNMALAVLAAFLVGRLAVPILGKLFALSGAPIESDKLRNRLGALRILVFLLVLHYLLTLLDMPIRLAGGMYTMQKVLLAVALILTGFQCVDLAYLFYQRSGQLDRHRGLGDLLAPFTSRLIKLGIILAGVTYLVVEFGEADTLKQFLTGLGIAGLAVSLAAQDSLKNLFATLILIGDRTFSVGDRLMVGDKEGVVEQLGFRSTKLRTPEDSLLVLPNSVLAYGVVDNLGLRKFRRIRMLFVVPASTPLDRVSALRDRLRTYLGGLAGVDHERTQVHVNGIQNGGVALELIIYFEAKDATSEKQCREEVTCEIVKQARSLEVELQKEK